MGQGQRNDDAVSAFVERFSSVLVNAGWQRMPARVFVTLLASESASLTAADLAVRLQVSPAAISGAVRFLLQLELASRTRKPGSRRDEFRIEPDVWHRVIERQTAEMAKWRDQLQSGLESVGADTPAADRLNDMIDFFAFIEREIPSVMRSWRRPSN